MKIRIAFVCILLVGGSSSAVSEIMRPVYFYPDISETKNLVKPAPGTVLNAGNIERYKGVVDPLVSSLITDGKLTITVGVAGHFPVHAAYMKATEKYSADVQLGDEPGVLHNYIAGRPFPVISDEDPKAGEKIAWNMRYAYNPDESELPDMYWQYRNMKTGKIERNLEMSAKMLRFSHRHTVEPTPRLANNKSGIFNAMYLRVEKPLDIRNTQLLIHRLEDDTKEEQVWMYTATQRRVRRLASGQMTDAFLGSDIMIEDFLGFNGRIKDMEWHYLGSKWTLMPLYNHNQSATKENINDDLSLIVRPFKPVGFHGQGNCFPDVSWQLRKVYIVNAVPRDENHPLSKRTFYIDAQGSAPPLVKIYDRADRIWKLGLVGVSDSRYHLPANKDWQGGIAEAVSMIDLQAEHCTTIQLSPSIPKKQLKRNQFTVQYLRSSGR